MKQKILIGLKYGMINNSLDNIYCYVDLKDKEQIIRFKTTIGMQYTWTNEVNPCIPGSSDNRINILFLYKKVMFWKEIFIIKIKKFTRPWNKQPMQN